MIYHNFYPFKESEKKELKYIKGDYFNSIGYSRYDFMHELALKSNGKIKISLRNPKNNYWTKWLPFFTAKQEIGEEVLVNAFDMHRSMMDNEIVVESDYKEYKDNVAASKIVGRLIEEKGFIPHYYYSGSKSIHIHIFLDYLKFDSVLDKLFDIRIKHFESKENFYDSFIVWMREQMITCWGLKLKEFDKDLINPTHLIRAELSKNKKGHKTFLGYSYKDLPEEPVICNYETNIYPKIATTCNVNNKTTFKLKYSVPNELEGILREFLSYYDKMYMINKMKRKSSALWLSKSNVQPKTLRYEVSLILKDDFSTTKDGMKRALFILCNELKQVYPKIEALKIANDWNIRMGEPFRRHEIDYRINNENKYSLRTDYINDFLREIRIL